MMKRILIFSGLGILLLACGRPSPVRPDVFIKKVETAGSGLLMKKEIANVMFSVQYKPVDYILSKELMNHSLISSDLEKRRKQLDGYRYFTFRVKGKDEKDPVRIGTLSQEEYDQKQGYLSSDIQRDFLLVEGKDSVPCSICHYEKTYGLSPFVTLVLAFKDSENRNKEDNELSFLYQDHVFGAGNIWMKISTGDLKDIPTVNFN